MMIGRIKLLLKLFNVKERFYIRKVEEYNVKYYLMDFDGVSKSSLYLFSEEKTFSLSYFKNHLKYNEYD